MKQLFFPTLLCLIYSLSFSQATAPIPEEIFVDSLSIGKKGQNKIELLKYRISDSNYVIINFYAKRAGEWKFKNKFEQDKDEVLRCDPEISDFNNDKSNDFTYVSTLAARGANQVRRLFIYDKINDQLIYIKNSDEYPNLLYNNELNCIDAFLVYGGCETVFLKLHGDKLVEFASVELSDGLTVTTYDTKGKEKVIYRNKKIKGGYTRYKNYKPLKQYED